MARYTVVRVRKEWSADLSHRHIEGVLTNANQYFSCQQVADSIDQGDVWVTSVEGYSAPIAIQGYCPERTCTAKPTSGPVRTASSSTISSSCLRAS